MFKNFITDYCKSLKDVVDKEWYSLNLESTKDLKNAMKRIYKKHPEYFDNNKQTGGGIKEKLTEVESLMGVLRGNINTEAQVTKMQKNISEINDRVDTLIETLSNTDGRHMVVTDEEFGHNIEVMKSSIGSLHDKYQIHRQITPEMKFGNPIQDIDDSSLMPLSIFFDRFRTEVSKAGDIVEQEHEERARRIDALAQELRETGNMETVRKLTQEYTSINQNIEENLAKIRTAYNKDYDDDNLIVIGNRSTKETRDLAMDRIKTSVGDSDGPILAEYGILKQYIDNEDNNEINKIARINIFAEYLISLGKDCNDPSVRLYFPIYNGQYTIFLNNTYLNEKINNTADIFTGLDDIITNIRAPFDSKKLYNPDIAQQGGSMEQLKQFIAEFDALIVLHNNYKILRNKYGQAIFNLVHHTIYLSLISVNHVIVDNFVMFVYINKGLLMYYYRIAKSIRNKITSEKAPKSPIVQELAKRHRSTVILLEMFLKKVIARIDTNDIIDIRHCKGNYKYGFALFNHFKSVLDTYRSLSQEPTAVFCRINDWGEKSKPTEAKIFLSDSDKQKLLGIKQKESDEKGYHELYVKAKDCECDLNISPQETEKYCFTEVFDTTKHPDNSAISNYMALQTQIAFRKGSSIMTYGYSGVGKTFTLFGNTKERLPGVLQSTLNGINGLDGVAVRVFELYGLGVSYPHYWENKENIYHKVNKFKTDLSDNRLKLSYYPPNFDELSIEERKEHLDRTVEEHMDDIDDFIKPYDGSGKLLEDKYTNIPADKVGLVFAQFETYVEEIENSREYRTIPSVKATPNNPISSRSLIVYDFQIKVKRKESEGGGYDVVPFIIVDLPGREELVQTYVDEYMKKQLFKDVIEKTETTEQGKKVMRNVLSACVLNPLMLPLFYLDDRELKTLPHGTHVYNSDAYCKYQIPYIVVKHIHKLVDRGVPILTKPVNGVIFNKESIESTTGEFKISRYYKEENGKINMNGNKLIRSDRTNVTYSTQTDFQYESLLATILINRLIMDNQFETLFAIIKEVYDIVLNNYVLNRMGLSPEKKREYIRQAIEKTIPDEHIDDYFKKYYEFDYVRTPFEGIFINENIIGLLYYLIVTGNKRIDNEAKKKERLAKIVQQDESLKYDVVMRTIRDYVAGGKLIDIAGKEDLVERTNDYRRERLRSDNEHRDNIPIGDEEMNKLYESTKYYRKPLYDVIASRNSEGKGKPDGPLKYNDDILDEVYKEIKGNNVDSVVEGYQSDHIYRKPTDENSERDDAPMAPLVTGILLPYLSNITEYKLFYLLTNNDMNKKCEHQLKLLKNTKSFIDMVVDEC